MYRLLIICGLIMIIITSVTDSRPLQLNLDRYNGIQLTNLKASGNSSVTPIKSIPGLSTAVSGRSSWKTLMAKRGKDTMLSPMSRHASVKSTQARTGDQGHLNKTWTPEYMMELYDRLSKSPNIHPNSNIVRSFKNIHKTDEQQAISEQTHSRAGYRVHSLEFDISSLDFLESINTAELRLYTLIKHDQRLYDGVGRLVFIYEIVKINNAITKHNFITSKYIHKLESEWESFDVTAAVKRSIQQGSQRERLEVRIQSHSRYQDNDDLQITTDPGDVKQPILVVYSNDQNPAHEHMVERHEMLLQEQLAMSGGTSTDIDNYSSMYSDKTQAPQHSRHKRYLRAKPRSPCQKRPMMVSFNDINYHDWIIAPKRYQAYQCAGKCFIPLSNHLTPTKHAIIQSLMHIRHMNNFVKPCCVPTKLDPISILYFDVQGVVTFRYKYDGMVVSECGCR